MSYIYFSIFMALVAIVAKEFSRPNEKLKRNDYMFTSFYKPKG